MRALAGRGPAPEHQADGPPLHIHGYPGRQTGPSVTVSLALESPLHWSGDLAPGEPHGFEAAAVLCCLGPATSHHSRWLLVTASQRHCGLCPYLDVAFVGCSYASLHIHAEGPLGLLGGYGAHLGGAVFAGHVAGERAHWKRGRASHSPTAEQVLPATLHQGRPRVPLGQYKLATCTRPFKDRLHCCLCSAAVQTGLTATLTSVPGQWGWGHPGSQQ